MCVWGAGKHVMYGDEDWNVRKRPDGSKLDMTVRQVQFCELA